MKPGALKILTVWVVTVVLLQLCRLIFVGYYHSLLGIGSAADILTIAWHGLPMDCSVAGYLSVIPALLTVAMAAGAPAIASRIERVYYFVAGAIVAIVTVVDAGLYGYWDFRLDMTPVFYLTTSPAAAMASVEWWMYPAGILAVALLTAGYGFALLKTAGRITVRPTVGMKGRALSVAVLTLMTALLFLPIRGGVTVSTMNLSRAYFSDNQRFNHAAINPLFSLLYSATHRDDDGKRFEYFDDEQLTAIMKPLTPVPSTADSVPLLRTNRPDIYIIIMESFSAHIMASLGGEPVATSLDSIAAEGVLFTNFYANSFRTDRGLPAILSGFPGQPTTSVMKNVEKAEHLPSIAEALNSAGYQSSYYYGGDLNFTNMLAYLVNSGFTTIVGDRNFPLSQKTSKWGADDAVLFNRALKEINARPADTGPQFTVIQTSSSHEPFEVPEQDARFTDSKRKNAFAFTDHVIARFLNALKASPRYDRTLVILVPDHQGGYPENMEENARRHHIPLILTGGALTTTPMKIDRIGAQVDIAAILLGRLGLDHSQFTFSKDILNPASPSFAFFTSTTRVGLIDEHGETAFDIDASRGEGPALPRAKAYLQSVYRALNSL